MLVLTRRLNESILIGDDIEIKVLMVRGGGDQAVIRLGITAPRSVTVLRKEVYDEVVAANRQAAQLTVEIPLELLAAAGVITTTGDAPGADPAAKPVAQPTDSNGSRAKQRTKAKSGSGG